jgi:sugar phosphate isomerase/epimerase
LEHAAAEMRRLGCEGLELRLLDGELVPADLPTGARERVRSVLAGAGLRLVALDSSIRLADGADADLAAYLRLAADLGAPLLRVFGGEGGKATAAAALRRAAAQAERLGVGIGLETHDAFSSARTVAAVLAEVPSRRVGAIWDVLHTHRMGESPAEVVGLLGDRVLDVHVKDARRAEDGGWPLVPLGEGDVPARECLAALAGAGYAGPVVVEWEKRWHPEIAEPEVALPHEIGVLRDWLDMRS